MSRLDSFIRRMSAQRDVLNMLSAMLDDVPGLVLELGLGSGRTFDHLRERFPTRRIVAFENDPSAHVLERFTGADVMVGDLRETTLGFQDGSAALIHLDLAGGRDEADQQIQYWLAPIVVRLLTPGGYVASDIALGHPELAGVPLPQTVAPSRYHMQRRA